MKKFYAMMCALACGTLVWAQEPLTITINEPVTISAGGNATLSATWAGGTEPYTIVWADQQGNVITPTAGNEGTINVTPAVTTGYTLTVTDANGQSLTRRTGIKVLGAEAIADFEDNVVPADGYDQGYSDREWIYSGSYGLEVGSYYTESDWGNYWTWYGYALSNLTANTYSGSLYPDQFYSAPGGAHSGDNFIMANPVPFGDDLCAIVPTDAADGKEISGFYITNSAYTLSTIKDGNYYSQAFKTGDWFLLQVFAKHPDGTTTSKDFYLADYRSENTADHYALDKWEWLDLSDMGKITSLTFNFDSSDKTSYDGGVTYYINTPMNFAMDDLGGTKVEAEQSITTGGVATIDLADYFDLADDGTTVTYGIEQELSGTLTVTLKNGKLQVRGTKDKEVGTVHVWATQRGHTQYLALTIAIDHSTGISDINAEQAVAVKYINMAGMVSSTPFDGVNIEVKTMSDGSTVTTKVLR